MTTYDFTTFEEAIQDKLDSASASLSAQDYLLLAKACQTAIDTANGVTLLDLKGTANGVAGLDSTGQVPASQLLNAIASQINNSGKLLTTNGTTTSWTNTATLSTISTSGNATIGGKAYVGSGASEFDTSAELTSAAAVFNLTSSANSYGQVALHNSTSTSSTDFIAYANNGVDAAGWIDMGITGSSFNSATYGITGPHDGYIFMQAPSGTTGDGNLVIATGENGTDNKIVFAAGGYDTGNTQMSITPDVNVHIEIDTPSTSATTGALTVVGGVGISGDLNIQGDVDIQGTITFGGAGTTVETANLSVTDPLVFVGKDNSADISDLGLVGEYKLSSVTKYSGVVRDASDGIFKFFKGASTKPTSTVNFAESGLTYADLKVAAIDASSITVGDVSNTEFGYLNGVTSSIQTQIDAKAPLSSPTFTGTVTVPSTITSGSAVLTLPSSTSTIATTSDITSAVASYTPLLQTTTTPTFSSNAYTLQSGDKDKVVLLTNGSTAGTVTIPTGTYSVGTVLTLVQTGSGQITISSSGTINSYQSQTKLSGQYASAQIIVTATNTFLLVGNLSA
jgi:hypothetical protein